MIYIPFQECDDTNLFFQMTTAICILNISNVDFLKRLMVRKLKLV